MNGSVIKAYADSIPARTYKLYNDVSELGLNQVAVVDGYTSGGELVVRTDPVQDGMVLSATGRGALVIEFGAGLTVDSSHPYAGFFNNVTSGGYSSTVGTGEFAQTGKWHWKDMEFTHIYPRRGMLHASQVMKKNIKQIAMKVFKAGT